MVDKDKDVLSVCQRVGYEAMSNLVTLMMIEFIGILKDIASSVVRLLYFWLQGKGPDSHQLDFFKVNVFAMNV